MAGATTPEMVIAVSNAGGLGGLPSALYTPARLRATLELIGAGTSRPVNLNFFCYAAPGNDRARQAAWRLRLAGYYAQAGLASEAGPPEAGGVPASFDDALCAVVEDYRPRVVSFHFGLPAAPLLDRVRRTGAKVISSATNASEARRLQERGADAVIAMGAEAGGHRGSFLADDIAAEIAAAIGTFALVPQIADAVTIPVIAAGGIADRRGVAAAFALGASAVQVGTAYLLTPEARISPAHRSALGSPERMTAVTNLFTGLPARAIVNRLMAEVGPYSPLAPSFPNAGGALGPLRNAAEAAGNDDFTPMWAGQAFPLASPMSCAALTRSLIAAIPQKRKL